MILHYLKTNFYNSIINNLFIISFSVVLFLISLNHYIVLIGFIIYLYYLYKKDKNIFILSLALCAVIFIVFITIKIYQNYIINGFNNTIIGKVIKLEQKDYYQKITLRYKIFKVIVKDYNFIKINLGDKIKVTGNNIIPEINHIPNAFNYKNYFYNNLYALEINADEICILNHNLSIYKLNEIVNKYLEKYFNGQSLIILKGFIIGDTSDFNDSLNESLKINGIIHLFAISGSHIVLIISFLEKILNKLKNKNKIINIILFLYLLITRFTISITRAIITYYCNQLCKLLNIKLTSLDISSLVFIILIIINPYLMYNLGFILSFASTFLIILISPLIKKINNIKSILLITITINIFSLPLTINMNNEYNLLSPLINVLMILLVEGVLIPMSFIVAVFPILNIGYTYIVSGFISFNELIADASYKSRFVIVIGQLSNLLIIIYYLFLFFMIIYYHNNKIIKWLKKLGLLFLVIIPICSKYSLYPKITFLDLYNGDSTIIEYKDEVIVIDTGEGINNEVSSFLKSQGISKIDYLILTHNHSDHNGEAKQIINNFNVTNIIVSAYDNSEFSKHENSIKLRFGSILKTKYINIECLFPIENSSNINNNSLVLYFKIKNISFLFTGDIEEEIENQFKSLNIDVLKVSHHGSNTSTTESFINKIKPKNAIIMSGRNNKFEFPSNEVINRLEKYNCKVYCTKDKYTIILKIKGNKCIFTSLREKLNKSIKSIYTFGEYIFEMSS